ncbi:MAG TPA: hypothetical protein VEV17_22655 [Bryobacteraceae bacterium]|nr:hypothetical protein [Bryobacteraceae bacterium]
MYKLILAAVCCALIFVMFPMSATADTWNKRTVVTFSQPVELPGIVLPAGTYVFKLLDSPSDRHIVQVFDADEMNLYTTILAIPNYRLTPSGETVMSFAERPANTPQALRAWFYPGDNFGQEFVYPKAEAVELAETAKVPVLSAEVKPAEPPEELVKEPVFAITPEKREIELSEVIEPAPPVEQVVPAAPAPVPVPELPKTASPLPLVALVGISALGLAAALKAVSKYC